MASQESAYDVLRAFYTNLGLATLVPAVIGYAQQGITNQDEVMIKLQDTSEWKTRFAGNEARKAKHLPVLSPSEYIAKENALREQMRSYGLPSSFYDDPADYARAIGADIGAEELGKRLDARKAIVEDGLATGVLAYARDNYNLSDGDMLAFFIDPDRAVPVLTRMAQASQIGAAAKRTGFGDVGVAETERLAALGISDSQAAQGYSQAAAMGELTQSVDDKGLSRDDLTGAIFDQNADAAQRVTRKQEERKARFGGGGSFAESKSGVAGLGSANT